jgi:hypothetical protein
VPPERGEQLGRRELQSQGQEKQHDADLGRCGDEGLGGVQGHQPALAQRQARQQHERDRREIQAPGAQAQRGQTQEEQAELDQQGRDVVHAG